MFLLFIFISFNIIPQINSLISSIMDSTKIDYNLFSIKNNPQIIITSKTIVQWSYIITNFKGHIISHTKVIIVGLISTGYTAILFLCICAFIVNFYIIQRE